MKIRPLHATPALALAAALLAGAAWAQGAAKKDEHAGHGAVASPAQATAHKATGTVKSVDAAKKTVTIAHEPVKSLNWPAMTMPFSVKDAKMLEKLKPGQKTEFEFVQDGASSVITAVK